MSSRKPRSKKSVKPGSPSVRKPARSSRSTVRSASDTPRAASLPRVLVQLSGPADLVGEFIPPILAAGFEVAVFEPRKRSVAPPYPPGVRVIAVPDARASIGVELTLTDREDKQKRLSALDGALPPESVLLTNALTFTVAEQATWIAGKQRLLGIGVLPSFIERSLVEVAPCALTPTATVEAAREFFRALAKKVEIVQDRTGLVAARVICQIINEAAFALQDDVAAPQDIDTSMKLGVSYPFGPFEWADRLGIGNVVAVLQSLQGEYQEERYRVSPLLRSMALGGQWWKQLSQEQTKAVGS